MSRALPGKEHLYGRAGAMARPTASWILGLVVLALVAASWVAVSRFGLPAMTILLGALIASGLMIYVSQRDYSVVVIIWLITMSGFHTIGMVRMPGLPDFSFARLMLIWMMLLLVTRYVILGRRPHGPYLADMLLLAYTVYLFLQSQIMNPISFHLWYLCSLSPFIGFLAGKYLIEREEQVKHLVIFMLVISIYYYLTSIGEHFEIRALVWPKVILQHGIGKWWEGRSRGPFLQAALFGQVMGMFLLVHFYLLARRLSRPVKVLLFLSLCLNLLGLFFTYTRGSWLGAIMGVAALAVLRPGYRRVVGIMAVALVLLGLVGGMQLASTEFLRERVENTSTIENRLGFLANATRMIGDHPLFGVGFFRYNDYREFYNQGSYVPFYGYIKRRSAEEVVIHDIYLGRLAEEGLVSGMLLTAFGLVVAWTFWRQWHRMPEGEWYNRDVLALFVGIIVAYLVGGMAIDYRYFDLVNVVPYFLAGIVYGTSRQQTDS